MSLLELLFCYCQLDFSGVWGVDLQRFHYREISLTQIGSKITGTCLIIATDKTSVVEGSIEPNGTIKVHYKYPDPDSDGNYGINYYSLKRKSNSQMVGTFHTKGGWPEHSGNHDAKFTKFWDKQKVEVSGIWTVKPKDCYTREMILEVSESKITGTCRIIPINKTSNVEGSIEPDGTIKVHYEYPEAGHGSNYYSMRQRSKDEMTGSQYCDDGWAKGTKRKTIFRRF